MSFPGWTWEYIAENMTMPRFNAILRHWKRFPPVHVMVAGLAGYKPAPPPIAAPELPPEYEE